MVSQFVHSTVFCMFALVCGILVKVLVPVSPYFGVFLRNLDTMILG